VVDFYVENHLTLDEIIEKFSKLGFRFGLGEMSIVINKRPEYWTRFGISTKYCAEVSVFALLPVLQQDMGKNWIIGMERI
jgi:hypothetical protein